jgi:hypothetical protein
MSIPGIPESPVEAAAAYAAGRTYREVGARFGLPPGTQRRPRPLRMGVGCLSTVAGWPQLPAAGPIIDASIPP